MELTLPADVPIGTADSVVSVSSPFAEPPKRPCTSLADWAELHAENWGGKLDSTDVEAFTGRRFMLPAVVGIIACVELFFLRRRHALPPRWERALRSDGASEQEVAATEQLLKDVSEAPFRESGLIGRKLYGWQFVWSTVTTLPIALLIGLIRDQLG